MEVTYIIEAIIGGLIGMMFWRIQKKIDKMESDQKARHKEYVEIRTKERELLIAEAKISALTARCVRGEMVNGDLEEAENDLIDKEEALHTLTRKIAIEYIESNS